MAQKTVVKFPSPYGVSFILMIFDFALKNEFIETFPSPYGVIFILTFTLSQILKT